MRYIDDLMHDCGMSDALAMAGDSIILHPSMKMDAYSHFINAFINVKCADTVYFFIKKI